MKNNKVFFEDWGLIDYKAAWDKQERLFAESVKQKTEVRNREASTAQGLSSLIPNYLVFCEHPHVYTLGKSGKPEHLLLDERGLKEKNASYYPINRGGDITYHGPGQLVVYPILDLENFFTDIHRYLRTLEEAVILTMADYGLNGERYEGYTGVWLNADDPKKARKICALGVRCSRWVTFNVNTDLDYFTNIIPCGIDDKAVTSMEAELVYKPDLKQIKKTLQHHISVLFNMQML
jgi:lipoyl(octanoyl) transferase